MSFKLLDQITFSQTNGRQARPTTTHGPSRKKKVGKTQTSLRGVSYRGLTLIYIPPPNGLVVRFVNFEPLEPGSIPGGEACQGASACPPGKCTGYLGGIYGTPPPHLQIIPFGDSRALLCCFQQRVNCSSSYRDGVSFLIICSRP